MTAEIPLAEKLNGNPVYLFFRLYFLLTPAILISGTGIIAELNSMKAIDYQTQVFSAITNRADVSIASATGNNRSYTLDITGPRQQQILHCDDHYQIKHNNLNYNIN